MGKNPRAQILEYSAKAGTITTALISALLKVSRQRAHLLLHDLVKEGLLLRGGAGRHSFYTHPSIAPEAAKGIVPTLFRKSYLRKGLNEDTVFEEILERLPQIKKAPKNVLKILEFGFVEMLNNAIDHSESKTIAVEITLEKERIKCVINDLGIGVFKKVMHSKGLASELEAVEELLKGKTTTAPENHTGQGIFFTSKAVEIFNLESFDQQLIVNNRIHDVFLKKPLRTKRGTRVTFSIPLDSETSLESVFKRYTGTGEDSDHEFDRTEIHVKLYSRNGGYISRSEARRILTGLDQFQSIIFDFHKVDSVGQGFADQIFRIFRRKHPKIKLIPVHMNSNVEFMIQRALAETL